MAGIKEIKNRIEGVRETQKITNAMYLVSSAKLKKAKQAMMRTEPYFDAIRDEIINIFDHIEHVESRYFLPEGEVDDKDKPIPGKYGYIIITADKGLAGEYNQKVLKEAERRFSLHEDNELFVIGEHGRHYFMTHGYEIEKSFMYTAANPSMDRARAISDIVLDKYVNGEISKIYIIYTDYNNGRESDCRSFRLLPFHRSEFASDAGSSDTRFEFVPSIDEVLDNIIPNYFTGYIYSALLESYCSEQNARMIAMDNDNRNAQELLDQLKLDYNHARQDKITQEITEVSSGAKSIKRDISRGERR